MNSTPPSIFDAINSLAPNTVWSMTENDYSSLDWKSELVPKPTEEELKVELERLGAEFAASEYKRLRSAEYPDFRDYIDGVVKGDDQQVQNYIDQCLAVKAKYPKSTE